MDLTVQYIIIAILFVVSVFFVIRKFVPKKSTNTGCGKGCGCSYVPPTERN